MLKMLMGLPGLHYYRTFKPVKVYAQQCESGLPLTQTQLIHTTPTIPASTNKALFTQNHRKCIKGLRESICSECHMVDLSRI